MTRQPAPSEGLREAAQRVIDEHRQGFWRPSSFDALEAALACQPAPSGGLTVLEDVRVQYPDGHQDILLKGARIVLPDDPHGTPL